MKLNWYDPFKFDLKDYQFYEKIENGDINWIIPGRMLAFSTPIDSAKEEDCAYTPEYYVPIFKKLGVTMIVRLTAKDYDKDVSLILKLINLEIC